MKIYERSVDGIQTIQFMTDINASDNINAIV